MFRGLSATARSMGLGAVFREAARRALGVSYTWRGVRVDSTALFRLLRRLASAGHVVWGEGGYVYVRPRWTRYVLRVPRGDAGLLTVLLEDLEGMYRASARRVLDVGAYIGETALLFAERGAERVYAYEPVPKFFSVLRDVVEYNGLGGVVEMYNLGVGGGGRIRVGLEGPGTGLREGDLEIATMPWGEVLRRHGVDLAKVDCEGCEWWLMAQPCEVLRSVPQWLVEIHGPAAPLIEKFSGCGFSGVKVADLAYLISLYRLSL
ncbi:FkbM family methyltransferase [Pyrobaculum neutrophilum]|uniref:Methyltransferase FkbM family n=1 Tax=Pyrobaculum neutrophilum (strain DSM 2338 / JCM 9278 / NBRC 100436 / V24Sta) TaxID=444157 RepID=B1YCE1_PYRNV|nr:FkbM family methyltransferase [Pyrobaculum neutrophilum]ACB39454.1 methyltransferase FkbM family [Pyrobaculum neutrophilum V24Sta]